MSAICLSNAITFKQIWFPTSIFSKNEIAPFVKFLCF